MDSARILVVDDDPKQLASLKRVLRRSKYETEVATNGRVGLRLAMRNPPDLVLLDVSMPTMSGYEFLHRFRRLEKRGLIGGGSRSVDQPAGEIPVIFLTALSKPGQRVDGLDSGVVDYVTKPFDPDELRARIRSQLRRRRSRTEILASRDSDLHQLKSCVLDMLTTARACSGSLSKVDTCLALLDHVDDSKVRGRMTESARQDVQRVLLALSRVGEKH